AVATAATGSPTPRQAPLLRPRPSARRPHRASADPRDYWPIGQKIMISGTPTMSTMIERGQAELPIIAEAIAAGAHHQHVALVADGRKEVAGRADGYGHRHEVKGDERHGGSKHGDGQVAFFPTH